MHTKFWSENLKGGPLKRPRRRWEDNIRMNLRENRIGGCGTRILEQHFCRFIVFTYTN
jgi:hypothetical protein